MKMILHTSESRGGGQYEWLTTRYSFSFNDWYDKTRMGFGALRVLNDDVIAPLSGFGAHGHRDMEIITIVTKGTVSHEDSLGNVYDIHEGDIQVMSAGSGVIHKEYNHSETSPLELFQIWITPHTHGLNPSYNEKHVDFYDDKSNEIVLVGDGGLPLNQDAKILYKKLNTNETYTYTMSQVGHGVYTFVIDGHLTVSHVELKSRDALGVYETDTIAVTSPSGATLLFIEVPMNA
jgi:redox-sensitive bicupin YhaK (pirin superfamily)